jgi:hypothetical protein
VFLVSNYLEFKITESCALGSAISHNSGKGLHRIRETLKGDGGS